MRLVLATRILNEDDIVEAFVRYHAPHAAQFVFLDDGSTDRTIEILRRLKDEGLPIRVVRNQASTADQAGRSTWLYHHANGNFQPDWVVLLDVDEFIDTSLAGRSIVAYLQNIPMTVDYITWDLINYAMSPDDDPLQPVVPRRLRWRDKLPSNVQKIAIRGGDGNPDLVIDPGQHSARCPSRNLVRHAAGDVLLAHFPQRSLWQAMTKNIVGWLKVNAAGETVVKSGSSYHYKDLFERILYTPASVISNPRWVDPPLDKSNKVFQPLRYDGGTLRYFVWQDPRMKAIQAILQYSEHLAKQYGRLMEEVPAAKAATETWYGERKILF